MERNQKKEEIKLDETVQKYNNTESEIVASVTVPAERGGNRKIRLHEKELKGGVCPRGQRRKPEAQEILKQLNDTQREYVDLQSRMSKKNQEIERVNADLKAITDDLTRCRDRILLQYNNTEGDKQSLSFTTETLQQNGICHSDLQFDTTSDKAVSTKSTIIYGKRPPLPRNGIR